jgi:hypothetical protein
VVKNSEFFWVVSGTLQHFRSNTSPPSAGRRISQASTQQKQDKIGDVVARMGERRNAYRVLRERQMDRDH